MADDTGVLLPLIIASVHQALHQHEPLIPSSLYEDFVTPDPDYHALFQTVPRLNKRILSSLFAFFALVRVAISSECSLNRTRLSFFAASLQLIDESQHNRMDADAVARSIGEMLLRPPATGTVEAVPSWQRL